MKKNYPLLSICLLALPFQGYAQKKANETKPNILFICVDDLRRELGAYGSVVKTPNIDRLASQGSLFFQHYVQVPTSGASRASMLTGHFPKDKSDLFIYKFTKSFYIRTVLHRARLLIMNEMEELS